MIKHIIIVALISLFYFSGSNAETASEVTSFDYCNKYILLNSDMLVENGFKEIYQEVKPCLSLYVTNPANVSEQVNGYTSYSVESQGMIYKIYGPDLVNHEGLDMDGYRATYAFFKVVNDQLKGADVKFYALYTGYDLGGAFLTKKKFNKMIKTLAMKKDWPYMPTLEPPRFGVPDLVAGELGKILTR